MAFGPGVPTCLLFLSSAILLFCSTYCANVSDSYNAKLFDSLQFKAYVWGDLDYYDKLPSQVSRSTAYVRLHRWLFYSGLAICFLLVLFYVVKYFFYSRYRAEQ